MPWIKFSEISMAIYWKHRLKLDCTWQKKKHWNLGASIQVKPSRLIFLLNLWMSHTLAIWFWRIIVKHPRMLSAQFVAPYKPCKPKPKPLDWQILCTAASDFESVHMSFNHPGCCSTDQILRPSYLHNGISYTGKTTSLYWIRAHVVYDIPPISWILSLSSSPLSTLPPPPPPPPPTHTHTHTHSPARRCQTHHKWGFTTLPANTTGVYWQTDSSSSPGAGHFTM